MTRELWSLKNLHFNGLLLTRSCVWATKVLRSYVWLHSRLIQSLKENWLVFPKLTRGIWQIFTRALESLQIGTLMAYFCLKLKMYELKIYRGVMYHDNEEWCKNWLVSSKLAWGIWQILTLALENLKNWPKYIIFELKKV